MSESQAEAGGLTSPEARRAGVATTKRSAGAGLSHDVMTRSLVVLSLGFIVYLFGNILMYRYGRDQGIYATVADSMLRGGMPYRDAWDFKPPGIFVVYAATRAVFGSGQWAIRLVEVL